MVVIVINSLLLHVAAHTLSSCMALCRCLPRALWTVVSGCGMLEPLRIKPVCWLLLTAMPVTWMLSAGTLTSLSSSQVGMMASSKYGTFANFRLVSFSTQWTITLPCTSSEGRYGADFELKPYALVYVQGSVRLLQDMSDEVKQVCIEVYPGVSRTITRCACWGPPGVCPAPSPGVFN